MGCVQSSRMVRTNGKATYKVNGRKVSKQEYDQAKQKMNSNFRSEQPHWNMFSSNGGFGNNRMGQTFTIPVTNWE